MQVGEAVVVARFGSAGRVVGISSGPGECSVTCTSTQSVQVVELPSGECTSNWAIKGGVVPCVPAAMIGNGKRLMMGCEDGTLLSWNVSDPDIGKGKSMKKSCPVTRILVDPAVDGALVFWSDNKVRLVSPDLKTEVCTTTLALPSKSELCFAGLVPDVATSAVEKSFLLIAVARTREHGAFLTRIRLRQASGTWSFSKTSNEKFGASTGRTLQACAMHNDSRILSVVWEGGLWQRYHVPALSEDQSLSVRGTSTIGGGRVGGFGRDMLLLSAGSDYLLSIGKGESGGCSSVCAFDVMYGTRQSETEMMDEGTDEMTGQAATGASLTHDGFWCAVALQRCVVCCSIDTAKMTLANVVRSGVKHTGKQPLALRPVDILACLEGVGATTLSEDAGTEEGLKKVSLSKVVDKEVAEGNERETGILARLERITSPGAYVEEVESFLRDLERHGQEENAQALLRSGQGSAEEASKRHPKRVLPRQLPSQYFVHTVVARCISDEAKGMLNGALVALLKASAVSSRAEPKLIRYAVDKEELHLVRCILHHVIDLSEADLVHVLKLVLLTTSKSSLKSALDAFVTTLAAEEPNRAVPDHDTVRRYLIDLVMMIPREHMLLVGELRRLTLRETVRFLKYCQSLLEMHGVAANAPAKVAKPKDARTPSLNCVVEWTSAVLDAHYTSLALAPDCRPLLQDLFKIVKAETILMRDLLSLDGLVSHIVRRKKLPVKPLREYSVETLRL